MTDVNSDQQWVWLARIRKAQGRKGEVFAELLTDFPEKFKERKHLWLLAVDTSSKIAPPSAVLEATLIASFVHKGGIVLQFAGIDSIPKADALRNMVVAIPRSERADLAEDEVYIGDLIGCTLIDIATTPDREIGIIEGVDRDAGPVALLVVRVEGIREEILVPFAKAYLRRIDFGNHRVEMALPEGLIEAQVIS